MSLFSLIVALLLEQVHPLSSCKTLHGWLSSYAAFFERNFNAGEYRHGQIAWLLAVVPPAVGVAALYWLLCSVHALLAIPLVVLVLYLTMGFRQFSHYFTAIHKALREDRLDEARSLLSEWRGMHEHELNAGEIARVTIEQALLASHRHVFGVIFWFTVSMVLGLGPAGAVLYRIALSIDLRWRVMIDGEAARFTEFSRQAIHLLEWLPLRMTAMTFAIVGNFEDAVYCWRTQAQAWPDSEAGIVLSSGAGALGVRLGMSLPEGGIPVERPELGIGDDADADFMQNAVRLAWRSIAFWLILLLLLTLAHWLG